MKGIIVLYINFHPDYNQDVLQTIDIVVKCNQSVMERINKESNYQIMIVPTTKEACRVEKIDFDKPFPRYIPKTHFDLFELDKKKAEREAAKEKEKLEKEALKKSEEV